MRKSFANLPENVKETAKVAAPLIIIVVLFLVVGRFGISKITDIRSKINQTKEVENILTEKLSVLQSISESSAKNMNLVTIALPGTNPSVTAVSQFKNIALKNGVTLTSIKSGGSSGGSSNLSSANTTFQATGNRAGILEFLKNVEEIAPLSKIDKVRISENGGITIANVTVKTYWATYPKTIPSVTQPVVNLTASEKQIIVQLLGLIQPVFSDLQPSNTDTNTTPFGQ